MAATAVKDLPKVQPDLKSQLEGFDQQCLKNIEPQEKVVLPTAEGASTPKLRKSERGSVYQKNRNKNNTSNRTKEHGTGTEKVRRRSSGIIRGLIYDASLSFSFFLNPSEHVVSCICLEVASYALAIIYRWQVITRTFILQEFN